MNKALKIATIIIVPTALLAIGYVGWKIYKKEPIFPIRKKQTEIKEEDEK